MICSGYISSSRSDDTRTIDEFGASNKYPCSHTRIVTGRDCLFFEKHYVGIERYTVNSFMGKIPERSLVLAASITVAMGRLFLVNPTSDRKYVRFPDTMEPIKLCAGLRTWYHVRLCIPRILTIAV